MKKLILAVVSLLFVPSVFAQSPGGPAGYTFSVAENGTVHVNGVSTSVAFGGTNGQWLYLTTSTDITCNNATFGSDPDYGVMKNCFTQSAASQPPPANTPPAGPSAPSSVTATETLNGYTLTLTLTPGTLTSTNGVFTGTFTVTLTPPVGGSGSGSTGTTARSVSLNWTASTGTGITGYKVYRSTTSGSGFTNIGSPTGTNYVDATAASATTYYYVVTSVTASAESVYSNQVAVTIP